MNKTFTNCSKLSYINISSFISTNIVFDKTFNNISSTGTIIINKILFDKVNNSLNN